MRAAIYLPGADDLVVETVTPVPAGDRDVILRVAASGVCHTDIHAADGDWPVKPTLPFTPGHEGVGTVAAVGAGFVFAMLPENLAISASYPRAFWLTVAVAAILAVPLTAVQTWQQAQHARQFDDWDGTEPELSE